MLGRPAYGRRDLRRRRAPSRSRPAGPVGGGRTRACGQPAAARLCAPLRRAARACAARQGESAGDAVPAAVVRSGRGSLRAFGDHALRERSGGGRARLARRHDSRRPAGARARSRRGYRRHDALLLWRSCRRIGRSMCSPTFRTSSSTGRASGSRQYQFVELLPLRPGSGPSRARILARRASTSSSPPMRCTPASTCRRRCAGCAICWRRAGC